MPQYSASLTGATTEREAEPLRRTKISVVRYVRHRWATYYARQDAGGLLSLAAFPSTRTRSAAACTVVARKLRDPRNGAFYAAVHDRTADSWHFIIDFSFRLLRRHNRVCTPLLAPPPAPPIHPLHTPLPPPPPPLLHPPPLPTRI